MVEIGAGLGALTRGARRGGGAGDRGRARPGPGAGAAGRAGRAEQPRGGAGRRAGLRFCRRGAGGRARRWWWSATCPTRSPRRCCSGCSRRRPAGTAIARARVHGPAGGGRAADRAAGGQDLRAPVGDAAAAGRGEAAVPRGAGRLPAAARGLLHRVPLVPRAQPRAAMVAPAVFEEVVRAAFGGRRKMLRRALEPAFGAPRLAAAPGAAGRGRHPPRRGAVDRGAGGAGERAERRPRPKPVDEATSDRPVRKAPRIVVTRSVPAAAFRRAGRRRSRGSRSARSMPFTRPARSPSPRCSGREANDRGEAAVQPLFGSLPSEQAARRVMVV